MGERIEIRQVTARYLGGERAEVLAGEQRFIVDERTAIDRTGARFCPIELVAASLSS